MNAIDENDKTLGKILTYGIEEAPAELELLVLKAIEAENAPRKSYMGFMAGWIPITIGMLGLVFGFLTSAALFFPNLISVLKLLKPIQEIVLNPLVMIIVLSVLALILADSFIEKRLGRLA